MDDANRLNRCVASMTFIPQPTDACGYIDVSDCVECLTKLSGKCMNHKFTCACGWKGSNRTEFLEHMEPIDRAARARELGNNNI